MALSSTKAIIAELENAITLAEKDKEMARIIVTACKIAVQSHALDFAKERLPVYGQEHMPRLPKVG